MEYKVRKLDRGTDLDFKLLDERTKIPMIYVMKDKEMWFSNKRELTRYLFITTDFVLSHISKENAQPDGCYFLWSNTQEKERFVWDNFFKAYVMYRR